MDQAIEVALIVVSGWIISVCFHEFAHAAFAYLGGDRSVKSKGYLDFNPFAYSDIRLSVILPTVFMLFGGIGLPGASVSIREDLLKNRYWSSLVSAAGPMATLLFSLLVLAIIRSGIFSDTWLFALCWLLNIEIIVLFLNLLPIPGLDGFGIIVPFLPQEMQKKAAAFYKHGIMILILLFWIVPGPNELLWRSAALTLKFVDVPLLLVDRGQYLYQKGSLPIAIAVVTLAGLAYFLRERKNYLSKAEKLLAAGKYQDALDMLEKQTDPGSKKDRLAALAYAGLSEQEKNEEKKEEILARALSSLEAANAKSPESYENYLVKGLIYHQKKNYQEALASYQKALSLNPENELSYINSCKILCLQERFLQVLELCAAFAKHFPYHPEIPLYEGMAQLGLSQFEQAARSFAEAEKRALQNKAAARELKELALQELAKSKSAS